jgi:predicted porin
MKKSLLALAALSAFATAAQAQSSVSVYGIMDMSYGDNKVTGSATASSNAKLTGLADDAVNSSRIGFRGTEDLGGGLKAGFVVEANLDMVRGKLLDKASQTGTTATDNTAFLGATRQTMVTLGDAKLGTLGVGYKKTLETDFNDLYFTGTENSAGNTAHTTGRATRANGIFYTSPVISGVTASVQYTTGQADYEDSTTQAASKIDASLTQIGLNYSAGPLQVGAVYFKGSFDVGTANDSGSLVSDYTSGNINDGDNDYKGWGIGANYNFGFAKVTAQMAERKYGLAADLDKNKYSTFGVTFPVGKVDLMAVISKQELQTNGVKTSDTDGYQLIARYNLSKRTNAYVLVGEDKFDAVSTTVDRKTSVARVGVAHSF